jgi:hypothetical protein
MEQRPQSSRDRLKKKLKDKKEQRSKNTVPGQQIPIPDLENENDIFSMISQVQNMLKTNPGLVSKVSNCVSSLMSNSDIMQKLSTQIEETIKKEPIIDGQPSSQILQTSSSGESCDAVSKES